MLQPSGWNISSACRHIGRSQLSAITTLLFGSTLCRPSATRNGTSSIIWCSFSVFPQNKIMNAITLIVIDGTHFHFSHKMRSITCTSASLFGEAACFFIWYTTWKCNQTILRCMTKQFQLKIFRTYHEPLIIFHYLLLWRLFTNFHFY